MVIQDGKVSGIQDDQTVQVLARGIYTKLIIIEREPKFLLNF